MEDEPAPDLAGVEHALDAAVDAAQAHRPALERAREGGLPALSPDFGEADIFPDLDNAVPRVGYQMLPMVCLGGSAGSIQPLRQFFAGMPAESGMVFVVIIHLSPLHESSLAEMLQQVTKMPVRQATDRVKVEANHIYVIPPGQHLYTVGGHLRLTEQEQGPGHRATVDLFFRALADTHGPRSIAVVFSGADGDGAIGIKRIKERGGLTIAQDPDEAEHPSMPKSAIATGMVDWVLKVAEMPAKLVEYLAHERRLQLPPEEGEHPLARVPDPATEAAEAALREVLTFLRTRTARDFSYYKRATILRRIGRRMQVNGVVNLGEYLAFMRTHPGEAGALLQDMLISVTNFFRDRDVFTALEAALPELFREKGPNDVVRVWVAACATGEEAYSIAMLLAEYARTLEAPPAIQIFATDLDEEVIGKAREGVYPHTIEADVSEERLRRFFIKEHRGYRVRREIRELVLFALHDLLKDSPFSRLDLVSCRNLLIYLNREAQARAFATFHFALWQGGLLLLGSSESVEEGSTLFRVRDKKHRLYVPRQTTAAVMPLPMGQSVLARAFQAQEHAQAGPVLSRPAPLPRSMPPETRVRQELAETARRVSWEELHFKLIEQFAPPSVIVNRDYDLVHVSQNAGRFLHFASGEPTTNLLKLVHPMLRLELRAALFRAGQTNAPVEVFRVPVELGAERLAVDLRVAPAQEIAPDFFLVVLAVREPIGGTDLVVAQVEAEPAVRHLEHEIEQMNGRLRETVEQYEAGAEELQASNEELQAMNEELRSATEELETSREELQSINEELSTVNQELKRKVDELAQANSDLQNLMASTAIATVFLDRELRIKRFTPSAVALFNLINSDLGRPLTDLTHRLEYPALEEDAERVLRDLVPVEREVGQDRAQEGRRWFLARLLPYRAAEDRIMGVVLTFIDITERRKAEQELRASQGALKAGVEELARQARLYDAMLSGIADFAYLFGPDGGFLYASRGLTELLELKLEAMVGKKFHDLPYPPELAARLDAQVQSVFATGMTVRDETAFTTPAGYDGHYEYIFRPVYAADGAKVGYVAGSTRDVTERRATEGALRRSEERLLLVAESARDFAIFTLDEAGVVTSWNPGAQALFGYTAAEILGQSCTELCAPEDRAICRLESEMKTARETGRAADERWHCRQDGSRFWGSGSLVPLRSFDRPTVAQGFLMILSDQTEAWEARQALEQSRAELWEALQENELARSEAELASQAKDHFLAVLSHELRTPLTPVLMAVHALRRRPDLPEPVREGLEMIGRNIQLEAHFIDDLLDVTRISRGQLEILSEPMDFHAAVLHSVEISEADLEAKQQSFTLSMQAGESRLNGDFKRLEQVIWNLLKNASKFTPAGGEIRLSTHNEGAALVLEVKDNGIGIEPEILPKVFEAFTQGGMEIARRFGGLGLGLAIVKATVLAHGGQVEVSSEGEGKGATFTVRLPLSEARPAGGNT